MTVKIDYGSPQYGGVCGLHRVRLHLFHLPAPVERRGEYRRVRAGRSFDRSRA